MTDVTAAPKFPRSEVVNSILSRLFAVGNHSFVSAIMDSPVTEFFWDLYHMFPHAKVVLTVRDVDEWAFKRVKEHHGVHSIFPISQAFGRLLLQNFTLHQRAYQLLLHHTTIACMVPPERLLVVNYFKESEGDIESRLIQFLGLKPYEIAPPMFAPSPPYAFLFSCFPSVSLLFFSHSSMPLASSFSLALNVAATATAPCRVLFAYLRTLALFS